MQTVSTLAIALLCFTYCVAAYTPDPKCEPCPVSKCGQFAPGQTPYSCPKGYVKDQCGCELQTCQCAECLPFDMSVKCTYGYRTQQGCPTKYCNSRPPAPSARCPNSQEPTGALGPECISKSECHPGDLCCKSYKTNSMNCMRGMRLEQVTPFPDRCGLPPPGPQTEGEECSPDRQCPIGYICCPTNFGSPLGSICRKDDY